MQIPSDLAAEDGRFIVEGLALLATERFRNHQFAAAGAQARGEPRPYEADWGIPQLQALLRRFDVGTGPMHELAHVPERPKG